MPDIFLSYNREDQAKAKTIARGLEQEGFDVWWDTVLRAGQTYDEVTERQLHEAKAVVVLWSSRSVRSKWVRAEATLGDRKSALIPVMIEQCDRPIMFELIQTADLTQWQDDLNDPQWLAFIADVRDHVQRKRAAATPATPAASQPAASASSASADTIEAAFWMSIQDGDDAEEFESYLERYPKGHFAGLAKKRLAALNAPKPPPEPPKVEPPKVEPPKPAPPPEPPVAVAPPPPLAPLIQPSQPRAAAPEPARSPSPQPVRGAGFQTRPATPPPAQARAKGGLPLPLIIGAVVVIGGAAAAFAMMSSGPGPESAPAAAVEMAGTAPAAAAVETPVEAPVVEAASAPVEVPAAPVAAQAAEFRDCETCPEMKRLPGGTFQMGSPSSETGHRPWEGPQRDVTIAPMAISLREVTFAEWDACVAAGGCNNYTPTDKGWGRGARPAMMVSWNDANAYAKWLSGKTGKTYRLPTEAEWEYAARGGTTTAFWWGTKYESGRVTTGKTAETGSHEPNPFGLYDVSGNVAEWVEDCYVNSFANAPTDGSAVRQSGCGQRVTRGGSWKATGSDMRIANRSRLSPTTRDTAIGFRVVAVE